MEKRPEKYNQNPDVEASAGSSVASPVKGLASNKTMTVVIACLAVAVVSLAIAYFVSLRRASKFNQLSDELTIEKQELAAEFEILKDSLGVLKSNYDDINAQLDTSRMQIDALLENIAQTDATNRAQIRKYQKELGTLRSIMKHYVYQIDSLNTANKKLRADNTQLKKKNTAVTKENTELKKTVSDLASKVETGAIVRGRDVQAIPQDKNGKKQERGRNVSRVAIYVTLAQNALAECGRMNVYAAVYNSDGVLIADPSNPVSAVVDGNTIPVSVCRDNVDYQGEDIQAVLYLLNVPKEQYAKGVYTVKVFSDQAALGECKFILK